MRQSRNAADDHHREDERTAREQPRGDASMNERAGFRDDRGARKRTGDWIRRCHRGILPWLRKAAGPGASRARISAYASPAQLRAAALRSTRRPGRESPRSVSRRHRESRN